MNQIYFLKKFKYIYIKLQFKEKKKNENKYFSLYNKSIIRV